VNLFGGFCDQQELSLLESECKCTKIYMRDSLVGVKFLREITTSSHNFSVVRTILTLGKLTAVAYSTSADSDDFNQLAWYGFILLGM
jgi:hypothetical protein